MQNLDDIMREAVNNVKTKKYNLLGVDGDNIIVKTLLLM